MSNATANAVEILRGWRHDPVLFVRQNFGVEPDAWQLQALRAFGDPSKQRISLQACAGPGKTAVEAWCGWHFLSCFGEKGEHPKGFAVSITGDNLKSNLWPEFAKWQGRSPYLSGAFTWTSERIFANAHKATWFLEARSWSKTATAEEQGKTLSGLHGRYVLVLLDESGGIPRAVARAADQALSTSDLIFGKILQAGNPFDLDSMLGEASTSPRWHVIRITGDPDDPNRSPRINIEEARQHIATYGRDNAWVMVYVLGQFPPSSLNSLIGPDEVRDAMARVVKFIEPGNVRIIGVDVAREGDDASAIVRRHGRVMLKPLLLRNVDSIRGASTVGVYVDDFYGDGTKQKADAVFIDNTGGFGAGWIDQMRVLGYGPIGVHFAGQSGNIGFVNKRAEMWFDMVKWIREGGVLHPTPELIAELTTPTYMHKGDRLQLEDKAQIKARLGRSPDIADALALTFAAPVRARDWEEAYGGMFPKRTKSIDHNPYGQRHRNPDDNWRKSR